ncbi:MAG: hypothetical protein V1837_04390 [Candidatus Woesearchaeota archaeon]
MERCLELQLASEQWRQTFGQEQVTFDAIRLIQFLEKNEGVLRRKSLRLEKHQRVGRTPSKYILKAIDLKPKHQRVYRNKGSEMSKTITGRTKHSPWLGSQTEQICDLVLGAIPQSCDEKFACYNLNETYYEVVPWRISKDLKPHASKSYQRHTKKDGGWTWQMANNMKERMKKNYWRYSRENWAKKRVLMHISRSRKKPDRQEQKNKRLALEAQRKVSFISEGRIRQANEIPAEERFVNDIGSLYNAAKLIKERGARADYFWHLHPIINEATQIILKYIQSKVERGLQFDNTAIMHMKDPAVNARLTKWEYKNQNRIINLKNMLSGRFYQKGKSDYTYSFVPVYQDIVVSRNYNRDRTKYITSPQEFLKAIRSALRGEVKSIQDFCVLDPLSAVTIEWCLKQNSKDGYEINPKDVASLRNPQLRQALKDNRLTDDAGRPIIYRMHFNAKLARDQIKSLVNRQREILEERQKQYNLNT